MVMLIRWGGAAAMLRASFALLGRRLHGHGAGFALNQITLGCNDYAAGVSFYRQLGLVQIVDSPTNGYARFEVADGTTLSLHRGEPGGGTVIYFEHPALDRWCAELADSGMVFDQSPRDESWGWREARLRDPAGNVICLYKAGANRRFPPWRIAAG